MCRRRHPALDRGSLFWWSPFCPLLLVTCSCPEWRRSMFVGWEAIIEVPFVCVTPNDRSLGSFAQSSQRPAESIFFSGQEKNGCLCGTAMGTRSRIEARTRQGPARTPAAIDSSQRAPSGPQPKETRDPFSCCPRARLPKDRPIRCPFLNLPKSPGKEKRHR